MNDDDIALLRRYVEEHSEAAFAELVQRHIDLVYASALRQVQGNQQQAEDITQEVFSDLARKSSRLLRHSSLAGWLYTSTRYAATALRRADQRRSLREQNAILMNELAQPAGEDSDWQEVRPILDEVMHELKKEDREAILLRFFERLTLAEVGSRLGATENTARMRVGRALERLRARLALRGISSSVAALGTALAQEAQFAAPTCLASRVAARAALIGAETPTLGIWGLTKLFLTGKASLLTGGLVLIAALVALSHLEPGGSLSAREADVTAGGPDLEAPATPGQETAGHLSSASVTGSGEALQAQSSLVLFFVDAKTGSPVTNRVVWLKGWEKESQLLVEKQVPLTHSRCVVPFDPTHGPSYWILTHLDGWADVSLEWQPKRGEEVPSEFTVRLVRPALIHGRVVDPAGQPVSGASVSFATDDIPGSGNRGQGHRIEPVGAVTDLSGRWSIERIAPDLVPFLVGGASHPEYSASERIHVKLQQDLVDQLLQGTFTFTLAPGIVVQGTVVDEAGQPVAGAQVHVGGLSTSGSRDGQTAKDGSFRIVGCPPGSQSVSADAAGYAPASVVLALEPNLPPVTLTLRSGQTLRVRVVDTDGQPIPNARLWYDAFSSRVAGPNPQVTFLRGSDADGRIVWEHAPDQEMVFTCDEPNHISVDGLVLRPDGQEHLITIQQALVISGTVRDAQTGELVPRFTLGVGWPQRDLNGSLRPIWFDSDRLQPTFIGGEYRHTLSEPVVRGTTNHGYVFRFQAPGYAPFVSRVYGPAEGNITLNVELQPVEQTLLTVYTPAGAPASWAQVAVLAPGDKVHLAGARFRAPQGSSWLIQTDERGQFSLPGVDTIDRVVITHHEGFLECAAADLRLTQAVRLRPWAGIQGVWLEAEGPVANCSVSLTSNFKQGFKWLVLERSTYQTFTDNNGNFSFSQVPPALLDVLTWQRPSDTNGITGASRMLTLETRSGITTSVSVGITNLVLPN